MREARVESYLKCYQSADLIITTRLHCALPSMALGTPVILVGRYDADYYDRLENYAQYCSCYGEDEILNGKADHAVLCPPQECLWYYWETEETLMNYYLIDDIIAAAIENFSDVRNELEQCSFSSSKVFELHKYMNRKYTTERAEQIQKESIFYKLNRQADYQKENIAGEQTIYGYFISKFL